VAVEAWKAVEDHRARRYPSATRRVAHRFEQERALLTAAARRSQSTGEVLALVGRLLAEQAPEWREVLASIYDETAPAFAARSFARVSGLKADATQEAENLRLGEIRAWFSQHAGARIVRITESTREEIRRELLAGVGEGEGVPALAKRLDALYLRQIIPNRSVVIARTEVVAASNLGNRAGAVATGLPLEHVWIATPGLRTRPAHLAASGQARPMAEPYTVGGQRLMFPGDGSLGATAGNLVQCRCAEGFRRAE